MTAPPKVVAPRRVARAIVPILVATLALAPALAHAANWAQFHRGAGRSGVTGKEHLLTKHTARHLHRAWGSATGHSDEGINSSPAVMKGVVYVGSDDGALWAFRARTGRPVWHHSVGSAVRTSPAVHGGRVFFGSEDGRIYAVRAKTGRLEWSFNIGGTVTAAPLVVHRTVFVGSRGGAFVALNAINGHVRWRTQPWSVWAGAAASARRDTIFVGSDQSKVFAYNAATGKLRWSRTLDARVRSTPSVVGRHLFVGTDSGTVWSLSARTGAVRWSTRAAPANTHAIVRSSPAVFNGLVYVSTGETTPMDGRVVAMKADTGAIKWQATYIADYSTSSPAIANGVLYVGSYDTRIYAIRASDGALLWAPKWGTQNLPRGINSSPAIANGRVYIGCRDGKLYAFGAKR